MLNKATATFDHYGELHPPWIPIFSAAEPTDKPYTSKSHGRNYDAHNCYAVKLLNIFQHTRIDKDVVSK